MRYRLPAHAWIGLALVAVAWPCNWFLRGPRTHLLFFPLWLGYVLAVDGLVARRTGSSILKRSPRGFALLFIASIPVWWLFEALNQRLGNWEYVGRELFSDLEFAVLASISFSTVIPAVFETADLWRSMRWTDRFRDRSALRAATRVRLGAITLGLAMLALLLLFPRVCYPLTWLALLFIADPIAHTLGRPSILGHLERGDRRPLVILPLGAITCGFFWEMWNALSYPKWIYHTPGVEFAHGFEMPLLGYFGYLPFGLELYPMAGLLLGALLFRTVEW